MPRPLTMLLFGLGVIGVAAVLGGEKYLDLDDECKHVADAEACAFNALQVRSVSKIQGNQVRDPENHAKSGDNEDLGSSPIWHYAQECRSACGGAGFCEEFCGPGNACCNYYDREVRECEFASFFPMILPGFYTCVTTTARKQNTEPTGNDDCSDLHGSCAAWAKQGECENNPVYMKEQCCSSCKPSTKIPGECVDKGSNCKVWAESGECDKNPKYMSSKCCSSCQASVETSTTSTTAARENCEDTSTMCEKWVSSGECDKNPGYMKVHCCVSCQNGAGGTTEPTQVCTDLKADCSWWAEIGECETNPEFLHANCRRSCKLCSDDPAGGTSAGPDTPSTTAELLTSTATPAWATSDCHTATADEPDYQACWDAIRWIYTNGFYQHPGWYEGLTPISPPEALQYKLHQDRPTLCPEPCAPQPINSTECQTVENGTCFDEVTFAKNDGIYAHPNWFPELKPSSPFEDFQLHQHYKNTSTCPFPCRSRP